MTSEISISRWEYVRDQPPDYTWNEFRRSFEAACLDAWEDFWRHPVPRPASLSPDPTITLPHSVFPYVTAMVNPATGTEIPITRISPFDWGKA